MADKKLYPRNPRISFGHLSLFLSLVGTVLGYLTALSNYNAPSPFCESHPVKVLWFVYTCGETPTLEYASEVTYLRAACEIFFVSVLVMSVGLVASFVQVYTCANHVRACLFVLGLHLLTFALLAVSVALYFEHSPDILDHPKGAVAELQWPVSTGIASLVCFFVSCVLQVCVLFTFAQNDGSPYQRLSYPFNSKEECCCEI